MVNFSKEQKFNIIFALFIGFLIGMNVLGAKLIPMGPFSISVAMFIVPLSFLITDIVTEVYGKKKAREMIVAGLITLASFLIFMVIFVALPPADRFSQNDAYRTIFGTTSRIMLASIVAFLISEYQDVWTFGLLKKSTKGKFLWLRTNVASTLAITIDTFMFMFLAFYMLTPKYTALFVVSISIPYLMFKILWGFVSSPFVYVGAGWLRGK